MLIFIVFRMYVFQWCEMQSHNAVTQYAHNFWRTQSWSDIRGNTWLNNTGYNSLKFCLEFLIKRASDIQAEGDQNLNHKGVCWALIHEAGLLSLLMEFMLCVHWFTGRAILCMSFPLIQYHCFLFFVRMDFYTLSSSYCWFVFLLVFNLLCFMHAYDGFIIALCLIK